MDALLAVSGLLAALGVGAVGVGYYRNTTGVASGSGAGNGWGTPLDPAQTTVIDDAAAAASARAEDIFNPPPVVIASPVPTIVTGPSVVKGYTDPDVALSDPPPPPAVAVASIGKALGGMFGGGGSAVQIL